MRDVKSAMARCDEKWRLVTTCYRSVVGFGMSSQCIQMLFELSALKRIRPSFRILANVEIDTLYRLAHSEGESGPCIWSSFVSANARSRNGSRSLLLNESHSERGRDNRSETRTLAAASLPSTTAKSSRSAANCEHSWQYRCSSPCLTRLRAMLHMVAI